MKVKASCGDEACAAVAYGKLTNVWPIGTSHEDKPGTGLKAARADLDPGETTTLGLELGKKTREKAREALDTGNKKVLAKVSVHAADTAGNLDFVWQEDVATAKRTIRLVK